MHSRRSVLAALLTAPLAGPAPAHADCESLRDAPGASTRGGDTRINIVGNLVPALQHIARQMESCSRPGLKVSFKMTAAARTETELAFATTGASPVDLAVVSLALYANLQSNGQLQEMNDLVDKYRGHYNIEDGMLVRVNGRVMAIAFMRNTQNLYYRKDLFDQLGLKPPADYAEMVAAAQLLRAGAKTSGIAYPIAHTYASGWDSATEFTNVYRALGGQLFEPGTAQPAFQGALGVQAVQAMRSLMPYMTPNALASNTDDVMNLFQQGKAAMGVLWASRAERMDDPQTSKVVGKMALTVAPAVLPGGRPASHLWWDGFVMPRRTRANRDTVFQVLMEALSERSTREGNDLAVWVRSVYRPTRFGAAVAQSQAAGVPVWPTQPFFNLAHTEIGKAMAGALAGNVAAATALADAARAYTKVAAEKGFLR